VSAVIEVWVVIPTMWPIEIVLVASLLVPWCVIVVAITL